MVLTGQADAGVAMSPTPSRSAKVATVDDPAFAEVVNKYPDRHRSGWPTTPSGSSLTGAR